SIDAVALRLENILETLQDPPIVIDTQNVLSHSSCSPPQVERYFDRQSRPLTHFGKDFDLALVGFNETVGHSQSESHTLLSRREERAEHLGLDIFWNANPCVLEAHCSDVLTRPRSYLELPPIRHRLQSICDNVGKGSAKQAWVD